MPLSQLKRHKHFRRTPAFLIPLLVVSVMFLSHPSVSIAAGDSGRTGSYYTRLYPDLFKELLGKSDDEIRARIDSTFNQLFFGSDETQRVYYPVGENMAYVEDIANNDVRTEGMSYGMMIAVQMNRKDVFDRIWSWAKKYMQIQQGPHQGYFAWHCKTDGRIIDSTAASDGEEWFVMSLFFASARWGDGEGIFNYKSEALGILNTMLNKENQPGHGSVVNMFDAKSHLVSFVPDSHASWFTDPSYQLPHYYELWERWTGNRFWCDAAKSSRDLISKAADPKTGLSPDYCRFDGTPVGVWGGGHNDFRFDAWRVAMNAAIDYEWFAADPREVSLENRLLTFFQQQGIGNFGNQFTLSGTKLANDHSAGLVAMNAVAAITATVDTRKDFVSALWNTQVPQGRYRYYDGLLYMFAMLQLSGNFKIYDRTGKPVDACGN